MMISLQSAVTLSLALAGLARAQFDPALVGTWVTKSKKVVTGPDFYDPVADKLIEPELAGISYSFTIDGFYEEAYYRAIPNPTTPQCPSSIMQFQHGTYTLPGNGSIIMEPFGVDGRQLVSSPCSYSQSTYTRYEQPELMRAYQVLVDPYHNVQRLNLFQFDGAPLQPMYLFKSPPQMLPTQTLNPTSTPTPGGKSRVKRMDGGDGDDQERMEPLNKNTIIPPKEGSMADRWWWAGIGLTALGAAMYMMPTSL